jgi:hypothetical protein
MEGTNITQKSVLISINVDNQDSWDSRYGRKHTVTMTDSFLTHKKSIFIVNRKRRIN